MSDGDGVEERRKHSRQGFLVLEEIVRVNIKDDLVLAISGACYGILQDFGKDSSGYKKYPYLVMKRSLAQERLSFGLVSSDDGLRISALEPAVDAKDGAICINDLATDVRASFGDLKKTHNIPLDRKMKAAVHIPL